MNNSTEDINSKIQILQQDITTLRVDAIVNAANTYLMGGGGVDGAIHHAAGPDLLLECKKLGGCKAGDVKMTPAFLLPARFVFHAVGPRWNGGNQDEARLLSSCYRRAMELANEYDISSIAFPAISCGIYRYPPPLAAEIALNTIAEHLIASSLENVIIAIMDYRVLASYQEVFANLKMSYSK